MSYENYLNNQHLIDSAAEILVNKLDAGLTTANVKGTMSYFADFLKEVNLYNYQSVDMINELTPKNIKNVDVVQNLDVVESILLSSTIQWISMNDKDAIVNLIERIVDSTCLLFESNENNAFNAYIPHQINVSEFRALLSKNTWLVFLYAIQMSTFVSQVSDLLKAKSTL